MIKTKSAGHFPTFLKTFVAPVDPEPIAVRSKFLRYLPIKKRVIIKHKRNIANIINNSPATSGEVRFGNQITGIKGYFTTVTISTDTNTDPGGMKEIFAVSSQYNVASY